MVGLFVLANTLEPLDIEDRLDDRLVLSDDEIDGTSYDKIRDPVVS